MIRFYTFRVFLLLFKFILSQDLPTNYEYFTQNGIESGLSDDQPYFKLNGKNITIFSGAFHYFRVHPNYWRDRLRKTRAAGLNTVETYVPWNLHEPYSGVYDFGAGGSDFEEFLNLEGFLKMAQEEDLFVFLRPGPYIRSELEFGGMPAWLLGIQDLNVRTDNSIFFKYVARYFEKLFAIVAPLQFTNGGPVIALQVEDEYGNTWNFDNPDRPIYLRGLEIIFRTYGIVELLYTSDPVLLVEDGGSLPGELLITANLRTDATATLDKLNSLQKNKPTMTMEYSSGWYDHYTENHTANLVSVETYTSILEEILLYPSSVNLYMFIGSTNWGFTNGAEVSTFGMYNSGLEPIVTSYDYDGLVTEQGQLTAKYFETARLVEIYNPIKTLLPDIPLSSGPVAFDDIKIDEQILLSEIIEAFPNKIQSVNVTPMEQLPINNNSGQTFGYILYRKTNLTLNATAVLTITGWVRDHVLLLLNGKLLNPVLSKVEDLDGFGYWRLIDSNITLTNETLTNATLDLVVENSGRNDFGILDQFQQFKGLTGDVLIDDEIIQNWEIVPLEFRRSWNKQLTGWHKVISREATPALYRVSFNQTAPLQDTYINVQDWRKGIAIINGFVLGRIFAVGPQQALYLPSGLLQEGRNEIIIFEHFSAPENLKFSAEPIWGYGTYIEN